MLVREYKGINTTDNGYIIETDQADINVVFMSDDIVRIRTSFDRKFEESSYTLVKTAWEDAQDNLLKNERVRIEALEVPYKETESKLVFETKTMIVSINKNPLQLVITNHEGTVIYSDLAHRGYEKDHLGRLFHYNLIDPKKDRFYGFGEQTGDIEKSGRKVRLSPKDAIGHDPQFGGPLYKHIPFYIRVNENDQHAIGLFYHNSYDSSFDMGAEISGYWDPYSYYQTDGGDLDIFYINGPNPKDVVSRYCELTGRQAMPPKQSLGFTASTMYYAELDENCDEEIYKVIHSHRNHGMNIDNFKLASGYSSGVDDNLRYVFNWNKKRFPNPNEFFKKMNDKGINIIVNLKPGILKNHPYMNKFVENDVFVKDAQGKEDYKGRWWGGEGKFVDFTKPSGRETWKDLLKESVLERGTVTVWNDNCEYDGVEDREALCDHEGKPTHIAELRALQANMMALTAQQAVNEVYPNKRPYIINRAGAAGIQRYAQTWAGDNLTDWRTLQYNISTIVGMGLSGVANTGCDIGGFAGPAPEGELLLRWIQNGIFQPRFCINSANSDNTVTQPWMYAEHNENVSAAYKQRYRMLPYIYSLMYQAHTKSLPLMRPLFMEFPNDSKTYADKHATFMYGDSLLVANVVTKGAKTRKLYLPKGTVWYDMNDHLKAYEGGQEIEIPVGLESIPMFFRDNGIYTSSDDIQSIVNDSVRQLNVLIGSKDASFTYYEDDGVTKDFENEGYEKTNIKVSGEDVRIITFEKEGTYTSSLKQMELSVISKVQGAYWVSVDGERIKQYLDKDLWIDAQEGWYYNLSDRTIQVKYEIPAKNKYEVVVSAEKFDLIGMVKD